MHDLDYVVDLAKAYDCSLNAVMFGVNVFSEEYGDEATADFVIAAGLPIFYQRVKPGPEDKN